MPTTTNNCTTTTTSQKTKTAAHKQRWPPTNDKANHGPQPPPTTAHKRQPVPTNRHRWCRSMTKDQGQWWGTRDDDNNDYCCYCCFIFDTVSTPDLCYHPSTNATPPPSTTHLITSPQWEGLPPHQWPHDHMKWNNARQQGHQTMDDKQPATMNDAQQQTANNNDGQTTTENQWQPTTNSDVQGFANP